VSLATTQTRLITPWFLNRVRLNHNSEATYEDVQREDANVLKTLWKKMKRANGVVAEIPAPFKAGGVDPSQLVQI
jgi:hypothetical protein